jgi:selenocysteine lyase/cysteine desulfurase
MRTDTKYLITTLRSNVIGVNVDFDYITKYCEKNGIRLIIDASQYIGHSRLSLQNLYFDALCAPGHKGLFGIQGSGILILGKGANPECLIEGGSGSNTFDTAMPADSPERYEAGTLSTPAIASLGAGIRYIRKIGIDSIEGRINELTELLYDRLSDIGDLKILGCHNGICAFNVGEQSSSYIADLLNQGKICVRGGFHCAPLTHSILKTEHQGAVRVSLSHFNSKRQIDEFYKYLKHIAK